MDIEKNVKRNVSMYHLQFSWPKSKQWIFENTREGKRISEYLVLRTLLDVKFYDCVANVNKSFPHMPS